MFYDDNYDPGSEEDLSETNFFKQMQETADVEERERMLLQEIMRVKLDEPRRRIIIFPFI